MASRSSEPTVNVPPEDAPGAEISGLPRYPGSVRAEYERGQRGGLETVRAKYLTRDGLDVVRGYYRGVFRAEGWEVANAEFYEDEWTFLVSHGEREAEIEIEAHTGNVIGMDIELSEPLPEEVASKKPKTERAKAKPAPPRQPPSTPAPQATPTPAPSPQSASPAPGYYGDDDYDDYGDDDGGDD